MIQPTTGATGEQTHRMFVRRCAFQAAAAAASSAALPPGIGTLIDVMGMDPVRPIQRRMLRILSERYGFDLANATRKLLYKAGEPVARKGAVITARNLAAQAVSAATRHGATRFLGHQAGRVVPIAGSVVAATIAFRATWLMGMACVSIPVPKRKQGPRRG